MRIAGHDATDAELIEAFNAVEDARLATRDADGAPVTLTYFEFGTLAALWLFARAGLDALILEVGLGGRLDAVNIVDPDVAIVTSVDIDHVDYLGSTREAIGREKAGIFRAGRPALCADPDPPASVTATANAIGAHLLRIGRDYGYVNEGAQWRYVPRAGARANASVCRSRHCVARISWPTRPPRSRHSTALHPRLLVSAGAVREGLLTVALPGRFQVLPGRPATVLDVAHNPHAARALADALGAMGYYAQTIAVCGMLADKDIAGVVTAMKGARRSLARRDHSRSARRERADGARRARRRGRSIGQRPMFADIPGAYARGEGPRRRG